MNPIPPAGRESASLAPAPNSSVDVSSYSPPSNAFDEFRHDGEVRSKWSATVDAIERLPEEDRIRLWQRADEFVRENGVTYNVFQDDEQSRPWEIDLFPLVFSASEWEMLERGLIQRTRLLNAIVDDVYGPQELLKSGKMPPELIFAHPRYSRAFLNLPRDRNHTIALCGYELARSPKGRWYVMADRFDAPKGLGYALENRLAVSRTIPQAIQGAHVRRLAPFFRTLRRSLRDAAARNAEDPRVVILTGGPQVDGYFEDVFLAQYLGFLLVEGGDLAVRDDDVFVKTVDGFLPVDVVMNRICETDLDPLEVATDSGNGVAGLLHAARRGRVVIANVPGTGLVESPIWMPFLNGFCEHLLGEKLMLPSIATWWCGEPTEREDVLDNIDQRVIKPAYEYSGGFEDVPDKRTPERREQLIAEILANPERYVAQERITRSVSPTWEKTGFGFGHNALRTFVTTDTRSGRDDGPSFSVMPGALVRVAPDASPIELSIYAGKRSKDAWVTSDGPVEPVTLLPDETQVVAPRRNSHLVSCRVADNLFWFGRTLNQLDFDARLLRAVIDRIESDRPTASIPEMRDLLRALAESDLLDPDYAIEDFEKALPKLDHAITKSIFSADRTTTIRSLILELNRLANNSRDRLSPETWQAVREIDETFLAASLSETQSPAECLPLLNDLILGLAACGGLISDGMVRGAAWQFGKIGRQIARAERTVAFLAGVWPVHGDPKPAVLEAMLEVMDGGITYRSRYLAEIHPTLILDLLVFDESNPRSLAFQLFELAADIDHLPKSPTIVGPTTLQTLAFRAVSKLKLTSPDEMANPSAPEFSLTGVLGTIEQLLKEISLAVVRNYLVLSRDAKQREDGAIRLR